MISEKRGQVSTFIIVAIIIVAAVALYFVLRDNVGDLGIPSELLPVFDYYQSCIEQETESGIFIMEAQGGRINTDEYFPGSEYAPFSSHLNFFGTPVPYWYYVSGNGIITENVPTNSEMEEELSNFVEEGLKNCDLEQFYSTGFFIEKGEPSASVEIFDDKVVVQVDMDLQVSKGSVSASKRIHTSEVNSKLGKFYNLAKEIYDSQKQEEFLEYYAVDVLRSYAPVDGTEIQCAPEIWRTRDIFSDIKYGLEENLRTIKFKGDYYDLRNGDGEYFVLDNEVDEAVNIMYSSSWPTKIEVSGEGVEDELIVSTPVGTQEGMGIMGFCYVPYHFVYDLSFPVMIQIYDNTEVFQFPVVAIVENNVPREAALLQTSFSEEENFDFCKYNTQNIEVVVKNVNLENVDANVSYECFDQTCRLGQTENGQLIGSVPACVNGYVKVSADGYEDKNELYSTNDQSVAEIYLDRSHELELDLKVGGKDLEGIAIVSFVKEGGDSKSIALPEQNVVELSDGIYELSVYVYGNTSIVIPATTKHECVEVPKGGILGIFGSTKEECFDITLPATTINNALIGGGKQSTYLLESDLEKGKLSLSVESLPKPSSIEQLSENFEIFETRRITLNFHEN